MSIRMFFAVCVFTACDGAGCASSMPARAQARGVVTTLAEGVAVARTTCAEEAQAQRSLPLARRCLDAYKLARASLIVASESIDAWDSGSQGRVACAIEQGASAAREMSSALAAYGADVPPALVDSLTLANALGALQCSAPLDLGDVQ